MTNRADKPLPYPALGSAICPSQDSRTLTAQRSPHPAQTNTSKSSHEKYTDQYSSECGQRGAPDKYQKFGEIWPYLSPLAGLLRVFLLPWTPLAVPGTHPRRKVPLSLAIARI